jgi:hypothetical protein
MNDENPSRFDFILPKNDLKKAIAKLENEYGIAFNKKNMETYFYEFKKK